MLLSNLLSIPAGQCVDVLIEGQKIVSVSPRTDSSTTNPGEPTIKFNNAIVFPGLINSHDHLDFNLFPKLGNRIYANYVEWGEDIHQQDKGIIDDVLKIPKELRAQWGIYKNLLNGVTTVVNHGPEIAVENSLITVWQKTHVLHSVQLEKRWKYRLNMPFIQDQPFSIHIGEGTDRTSEEEINKLIKWNLWGRELIGIHAVAMNEKQADKFKAIVWCPDSNYFLIGRTAAVSKLKNKTKILFGTDSTVSSDWNLWKHLRLARQQNMLTDAELFNALNTIPAEIWKMPISGSLTNNSYADVVIGKKKANVSVMDSFFALNPEDILMVIHMGQIRLFDEELYEQLARELPLNNFSKIGIKNMHKYVAGDLLGLVASIKKYYPGCNFPVSC